MWGLHRCLIVKESACNEGDTGDMNLIPGSGRCPGEGWARIVSSILAWSIPWTEEPGRLRSMGSWRVRQDWATSLSLFTFMHWRRKWQPTPVFLPGESQGQQSLVGCRLWGRTESDRTEVTREQQQQKWLFALMLDFHASLPLAYWNKNIYYFLKLLCTFYLRR